MRVGLCFDLKSESLLSASTDEDAQEEFDSPQTIQAIAQAIAALGHEPLLLGDGRELLEKLLADPPDFVFNLAEGHGISRNREARVPAVLEMLGIPYTGSDPLTLAATLDKDVARRLVASHGVTVPTGFVVKPQDDLDALPRLDQPHIVKPAWEGSSKGIRGKCVVDTSEELRVALLERRIHRQPLLVEQFIAGEEITVGLLGNTPPRVLGVLRVVPLQPEERFVYSLEVKRDFSARVRYDSPPLGSLPAVEEAALRAYRALGCRDVARIDFRLRDGVPYFLEANPLPGLNPETSDLVILARLNGYSHAELIQAIFQVAQQRWSAF
ncbi:MAG: D-alanine--D-alanine ligase [Gemmataceae bacterium]